MSIGNTGLGRPAGSAPPGQTGDEPEQRQQNDQPTERACGRLNDLIPWPWPFSAQLGSHSGPCQRKQHQIAGCQIVQRRAAEMGKHPPQTFHGQPVFFAGQTA